MALTPAQEKVLQRVHLGKDKTIGPDLKNARVLMHMGFVTIWGEEIRLTDTGKTRAAKIRTGETR